MIFALDADDGSLLAFASVVEAAGHCKGVDVQDGYWLFFSDDGSPLEARFGGSDPAKGPTRVPLAYTLGRAMSGRWLQERLSQVRTVRGCGLSSREALVETLKINRGKRVAADRAK